MMLRIKNMLFIAFFMLLLNACVTKEYTKQEGVFILFKTPTFKHADLGFIYENSDALKVEMYSSGQAIMALEIGTENVCMSLFECMDKKSFNKQILSETYPNDILQNIFSGKTIFSKENMLKTSNGFTQKLSKTNKYNIDYSVLNKQIIFRDTMNNILIKVKRLDG